MLTLPAVALTKAEFAPFDELAETDGVTPKLIKKAALLLAHLPTAGCVLRLIWPSRNAKPEPRIG